MSPDALSARSPDALDSGPSEPRPRVLFVTWGFEPGPVGGAERQARLQAQELTRRGYSVTVVCPAEGGLPRRDSTYGLQVRRLRIIDRRPFRRVSFLAALFAFCLSHARGFDLVHVHLANLQADAVGLACRVVGRPYWVKVACGGSQGEARRLAKVAWATRWFGLRHADRVQAISAEIADEMRELVGVPAHSIIRIPNGVDLEKFAPAPPSTRVELRERLGIPQDSLVVLYLGRLAGYKGLDTLLEAWHQARRPANARLLFVGPMGIDAPVALDALTGESVEVRESTSEPELYLRCVDAYINPAKADGMSNSTLEAMAAGLPVIATAQGANPELFRSEGSGLLVRPGDVSDFRVALERVMSDAEGRASMGRKARQVVESHYSISAVVDQISKEYDDLVGAHVS